MFRSLGLLASRVAKVPAGEVVVLESTGPVLGIEGTRIGVRDDGKPLGVALSEAEIEALRPLAGSDGVAQSDRPAGVTWISMDTESLTRRGAGRRSVEATRYAVSGDPGIAHAVVEALVITP